MKPKIFHLILLLAVTVSPIQAQLSMKKMDKLSKKQAKSSLIEFYEFLKIPNDAHYPAHVSANVQWCEKAFTNRGFEVTQLATSGPPVLIAEKVYQPSYKTVLFYLQVDGQPVDSSKWDQASPYLPVIKKPSGEDWKVVRWERAQKAWKNEWRIFARSASDAKGPIIMFLAAMDIMQEEGLHPDYNIKVIMDFEEEQGSPHLPGAVEKYQEQLAADMLVILDGPRHITNRPTLTFGARGITTITLTVFGPRKPQHSGHYGNFLPNPAFKLAHLLASMKDRHGRVTIPGFYDGIEIDEEVMAILGEVPDDEPEILQQLGVSQSDQVAPTLQEAIQYPSLNIRGLSSGWVGKKVRTIIPDQAVAEIDVRLVPETDSDKLIGLIKNHIEGMSFHFVDEEPTEEERMHFPNLISFEYRNAYKAFRTPYDSRIGTWLTSALRRAFEEDPVRHRISGGSIPISPFVTTLGLPAVTVPTVNRDNNQHSPNENLRLGNFVEGIKTCLAILTESNP